MTTIIKADGTAGFLGLVPALLGYHPENSVVAVPMKGRRTLGALRFDVPALDDAAAITSIVQVTTRIPDADGVVYVTYREGAFAETLDFMASLEACSALIGLNPIDVIAVASDGWGIVNQDAGSPRPLSEIVTPEGHVVSGAASRRGADLPEVERKGRRRVLELLESGDVTKGDEVLRYVGLDRSSDLSLDDTAMLALALNEPAVRDTLLLTIVGGVGLGIRAVAAQAAWEGGVEYPTVLAQALWGEGYRPDPADLQDAVDRVRHVAAHVVGTPWAAGALATLAWLCWALGRSSEAERWVEEALAVDPEHGLAEIVQSYVDAGHLPAWAFAR